MDDAPGDGVVTAEVPQSVVLDQNYPEPVQPQHADPVRPAAPGHVVLSIHNILGQEVARLVDEMQVEGFHEARWNGTNHSGAIVGSGVYFFRLQTDGLTENRRMLLLK
ncbi:MAG: T9SS type A sorting domain-containing protein [Ignavibacteriae bacterium]|nr:T9SS type A sorting domain-containing protein [Ignavibacteriota bacterium]